MPISFKPQPHRIDTSYSHVCGLDIPELLLREAYIMRPDITFQAVSQNNGGNEVVRLVMSKNVCRTS